MELSDDQKKLIVQTVDLFEGEDKTVRDKQIRQWKETDFLWRGLHYRVWSELAKDWQTPSQVKELDPSLDVDPTEYDRFINIFRAHGESIIAAMSATVPSTRFYPDDADNPSDIQTAKAYTDIEDLIRRHNHAEALFVEIFFKLCLQGMVFIYNYHSKSEAYGVNREPITEDQPFETTIKTCQNCGAELGEAEGIEQMMPDVAQPEICPECGMEDIPFAEQQSGMVEVQIGEKVTPKGREFLDIYGPLNVKIPSWIKKLEDSPYLILETEVHVSRLRELYPEAYKDDGGDNSTESWARRPDDSHEDKMETVKRCWLQPWAFNIISKDETERDALKAQFPSGCYAVICRNKVLETFEESLIDHWTASESPISNFIHADPLLKPLIPVQDMKNELLDLTMQTIEHAVPQVFADPSVLNFNAYSKHNVRPGTVYPAKAKAGHNLEQSFYTLHTASLSKEVGAFDNELNQSGQFVTGAFPSIYGGTASGGSKTYAEYQKSNEQALQRLSLSWKMTNVAWAKAMGKAVKSFAQNLEADERFVRKEGTGFVNVWIKQAFLQGNIGMIEPEVSDQFPISWVQIRSFLMEMLGMNNEAVSAWLLNPNNLGVVSTAIGIKDLKIPGEADRNKQLAEIQELLASQPLDQMTPSVMPEEFDNAEIHMAVTVEWLNSYEAQMAKKTNPGGYMNVVLHAKMHQQLLMQQQMQMQAQQQTVQPLSPKPPVQ